MTVYRWPAAKVWLITGGSRMEREQVLDERFEGHIICVKVLMLFKIARGCSRE